MNHDLIIEALKAANKGQKYAFATIVEATAKGTPRKPGAKMIVLQDGTLFGSIGGGLNEKSAQKECLKAIRTGKSELITYDCLGKKGQAICGGQMRVFVEPVMVKKHLIICGAGHIGLPLSIIAKILGYNVTVLDNRRAFANKKRFPHVDTVVTGNYIEKFAKIPIDNKTHVIILTHGHEHDFDCLKAIIKSSAGYIGVISSKQKRTKFFRDLKKAGVSEKRLKGIDIPAGIDIGAQTPEEIAVSIAAKLVKHNNPEHLGAAKFKRRRL